ncbi:MAG: hypothetical protein U0Y68_15245 [Blastocatellia bacterium]
MLTLAEHLTAGRKHATARSLVRSYLIANQRSEIINLGAGTVRPEFIQNTNSVGGSLWSVIHRPLFFPPTQHAPDKGRWASDQVCVKSVVSTSLTR